VHDFTTVTPLERAAHSLRQALRANASRWTCKSEKFSIVINSEIIQQIFNEPKSILILPDFADCTLESADYTTKSGLTYILSILCIALESNDVPAFVADAATSRFIGMRPGLFRYQAETLEISDLAFLVEKFSNTGNLKKRKISVKIEKVFGVAPGTTAVTAQPSKPGAPDGAAMTATTADVSVELVKTWIFPDSRHVVDDDMLTEISSRPATEVKLRIAQAASLPADIGAVDEEMTSGAATSAVSVVESSFGKSAMSAFTSLATNPSAGNFFSVFTRYLKFLLSEGKLGVSIEPDISVLWRNFQQPKIQNLLASIDGNLGVGNFGELEDASERDVADAVLFERGKTVAEMMMSRLEAADTGGALAENALKTAVIERHNGRVWGPVFDRAKFMSAQSKLCKDVVILEKLRASGFSDVLAARTLRDGTAVVDGAERGEVTRKVSDDLLRKVYVVYCEGRGEMRALRHTGTSNPLGIVSSKLPID
jgi:hypothetical protein